MAVLVVSGVQIFNYVCAAVFGVVGSLFVATAGYYGLIGYERTFSAAKHAMLLMFIAFFMSLLDSGNTAFTYVRPSDGVTVFWGHFLISALTFSFAAGSYFQILHDPSTKIISTTSHVLRLKDHIRENRHYIFRDMLWLTFLVFLFGGIFGLIAVVSDSFAVRWTSYALFLFFGIVGFVMIMLYISEYGFRTVHEKHEEITINVATGFWTYRKIYWEEWLVLCIVILVWLDFAIALLLGQALLFVISYDWEVLMYLIGFLVLGIVAWSEIYLARMTHVKMHHTTMVRLA